MPNGSNWQKCSAYRDLQGFAAGDVEFAHDGRKEDLMTTFHLGDRKYEDVSVWKQKYEEDVPVRKLKPQV